jgi:GNAT superfamily N-acetyltransferase
MASISIRPALEADLPVLAEFRTRMFREMGYSDYELDGLLDAQLEYFTRAMSEGRLHGWIAEEGGLVVGAVEVDLRRVAPGPVHRRGVLPYVYGLFVEPERRRQGIARSLMATIEGWVDEQGYEAVALHASAAGRPLYEDIGFIPTSEMRKLTRHADRHRPAAED